MKNKALLMIDIQNDYFDGGKNPLKGSLDAAKNAKTLLDNFRESHLLVIFIQHISNRPGSNFFLPETYGAEIHPLLKPIPGEKIIEKHYPNSFRETTLHEYLQTKKITDLVVCGMMTHMCVDATVRAAKDLGYTCTLIGNACATKDLQIQGTEINANQVHHSFLAALNYYYAEVMNASKYLSDR